MFPAKPVISLDAHPGSRLITGMCTNPIEKIATNRTIGLLAQAECLTYYAYEIFQDISNSCTELFQRVDELKERTTFLRRNFPDQLTKFKNIGTSTSHGTNSHCVDKETLSDFQFSLEISNLVFEMASDASPPPDFTEFTELAHTIQGNQNVDFNLLYSDPDYYRRNYIKELQRQIKIEQEAQRAAASEQKQKEKEEKRLNAETKKNRQKKTQSEQIVVFDSNITFKLPTSMQRPPLPGHVKHSEIINVQQKISLETQTDASILQELDLKAQEFKETHMKQMTTTASLEALDALEQFATKDFTFQTTTPKRPAAPKPTVSTFSLPDVSNISQISNPQPKAEQEQPKTTSLPQIPEVSKPKPSAPPPPVAAAPPPPPPPPSLPPPPPSDAPAPSSRPANKPDASMLLGVKLNKQTTPRPAPAKQQTHLDLIKSGNFKLKKVDNNTPRPQINVPQEKDDTDSLSIQDLLQKAAQIRDAVKCSDSSDDDDEKSSDSESW
ncbi:hypothetical protein TVAG_293070 [Trichomonas vaginalis G3]|uniref:WH2 motif family protein n=1 Tax=Trichomonas vaginalis (strain ATCC PRA-98 / G3) TaxID=412133 RepID=A2EWZ7_TRIV3|nr:Wiskott-Aldrich syndrome protein family [Trichomonas vaginalis G3]EAY02839.1 hypothetical protein TVAG_293070 [Trichomonas vaginalis G3]KAI5525625.1 Wiskott-Aldrich syndrome protein family [Trichomonas vaginalis G3]|eukprot:XP_001315062.1 hypothetical protein [Trichomonas vaginalis G3]